VKINSYYEALGPRQPRPMRGLLTRPATGDIIAYRHYVDSALQLLLQGELADDLELVDLVELGLAHEEQHQELILMDLLHLFSQSPLKPACDPHWPSPAPGRRGRFRVLPAGLVEIGASANGFAFDNERPRHPVWLQGAEISDRLVTYGEWMEFMATGGYTQPGLWLADGWTQVQEQGWQAPGYWQHDADGWRSMTLAGLVPVDPSAPVCTSVITRPRLTRCGPARACLLKLSGKPPPRPGCLSRWTTRPGSGHKAPIRRIPASVPPPARSANTTASSWWTRSRCAVAPA
jgi:ergothioneine biosynthesis protein EgtB